MNLLLPWTITAAYRSPSQRVRVATERWVEDNLFCPSCFSDITKTPNNTRALDFLCSRCDLSFELKSKKGRFGHKVVDGAYSSMMGTVTSNTQPNFFFLGYNDSHRVENLFLVPKRFIFSKIIEKRKPLQESARRSGWIGCNLNLSLVPREGRIIYIKEKQIVPRKIVNTLWNQTTFLDTVSLTSRSWLIVTMNCIDEIGKPVFTIDEVYKFAPKLQTLFPRNRNIKAKLRQQLQVLRNREWLTFRGNGIYQRGS
ncbi:MAG: restriction endonuclease [Candidatus Kaiserbacteria bacterium]|nr:restriction endonuclease [Candidatus Kaiserbacteria bacterium]